MRFFRKNPIAFSDFIGVPTDDPMFIRWRNNFEDRYEELFVLWCNHPQLRFGQLLINESVVPDGQHWHVEEYKWVVEKKWMKPEVIYLWGSLPLDYNDAIDEWLSQKPKFNAPIEKYENFLYKDMKPIDIYAEKYRKWREKRPDYTYNFLEDLEKSHIENILKNCQPSNEYKEAFERLLQR